MHAMNCPTSEYAKYMTKQSIDCCCLATKECEIKSMRSRQNIALPWKHYTQFKLHQLVHLLQMKKVNKQCLLDTPAQ